MQDTSYRHPFTARHQRASSYRGSMILKPNIALAANGMKLAPIGVVIGESRICRNM